MQGVWINPSRTLPDLMRTRLYYVLEPLYQSGVIYAPVDNEKVHMRPVISGG